MHKCRHISFKRALHFHRIVFVFTFFLLNSLSNYAWAACSWDGNNGTVASPYGTTDISACVSDAESKNGLVTISLPASTVTWTNSLSINMASGWAQVTQLVITGAGQGNTIITDSAAAGSPIFDITCPGNKAVRLTNMTIKSKAGMSNSNGSIHIQGGTNKFRIDKMTFDMTGVIGGRIVLIGSYTDSGRTVGVIDHCTFTATGTISCNGISQFGNRTVEWTQPVEFGTANALYIEDNVFSFPSIGDGAFDMYDGARYVFRYNTISGTNIGHHGNDSSDRSTVSYEIYGNISNQGSPNLYEWMGSRGGTGVIWGNTVTGNYTTFLNYKSYRSCPQSGNGGTEGTSTNTDNSATVLSDTNATFGSPVPFGGQSYIVMNLTDQSSCVRASNTSTTVTCSSPLTGGTRNYWLAGDVYTIGHQLVHKFCLGYPPLSYSEDGNTVGGQGYPCRDQVGFSPNPADSGTTQILTPAYQWGNSFKGSAPISSVTAWTPACARVTAFHIKENREYYDNIQKPGYTPFAYPHPLTQAVPAAPGNLKAQ